MKDENILTAKEVSQLLHIPLVTVQRWVHQGKIPCKFKNNDYFFKKTELFEWAKAHNIHISPQETAPVVEENQETHILGNSIRRGGIFYKLTGDDIYTVMKNAVDTMDFPENIDRESILNELINREEIASTGIGKGVAIPHPRAALDMHLQEPMIPIFFLEKDIDFNSVDKQPVFVLFFMLSPNVNVHLKLLSRLSFCLRDELFMTLLREKQPEEDILERIKEIERNFQQS